MRLGRIAARAAIRRGVSSLGTSYFGARIASRAVVPYGRRRSARSDMSTDRAWGVVIAVVFVAFALVVCAALVWSAWAGLR